MCIVYFYFVQFSPMTSTRAFVVRQNDGNRRMTLLTFSLFFPFLSTETKMVTVRSKPKTGHYFCATIRFLSISCRIKLIFSLYLFAVTTKLETSVPIKESVIHRTHFFNQEPPTQTKTPSTTSRIIYSPLFLFISKINSNFSKKSHLNRDRKTL